MPLPQSFGIGPLVLAADRTLTVLLIAVFLGVSVFIARKMDPKAERASWWALAAGLLAARTVYVGSNWSAFAAEPASIFALWQGGYSLVGGAAGAILGTFGSLRLRKSVTLMVGAVAILAVTYSALSSTLTPAPRPMPSEIVLEKWSGEEVRLAQLRGQPFVINLWASWCLPCRREMPMLIDVASRSSVPILLVNSGEQRNAAEQFLLADRLPSQSVYLDSAGAIAAVTDAGGYPTTLFINAAGQIETIHLGEISRAALTSELRRLEQQDR